MAAGIVFFFNFNKKIETGKMANIHVVACKDMIDDKFTLIAVLY